MTQGLNNIELGAFDAPLDSPRIDAVCLVSLAISMKRIADAAEKIAECADGIHPSAFRVSPQQ